MGAPDPGHAGNTRSRADGGARSGRFLLAGVLDARDSAAVAKTLPVLLEKAGREQGQLMGRSPYLQPVHVIGQKAQIGSILEVKIDSVGTNSLSGHIELVEA